MGKFIDLTGQRFGRLVVTKEQGRSKSGKVKWLCVCDCGKSTSVIGCDLRSGRTKSCGCLHKEVAKVNSTKHGKRYLRIYRIWCSMKRRTRVMTDTGYEKYGGRGIDICSEWAENFESFYEWSVANGYAENLTIDRINNDKGYSPENCRWTTLFIQARNKRNNVYLKYRGETKTLTDWSKQQGISCRTIRGRLSAGWPIERALTEPVRKNK